MVGMRKGGDRNGRREGRRGAERPGRAGEEEREGK